MQSKLSALLRRPAARALVGAGVPALLLAGVLFVYWYGSPLFCVTYRLLGIYCPGCGSGRAAHALLHLDLPAALGYNLLFVLALPPVGYYLLVRYVRYVFGLRRPPVPNVGARLTTAVTVTVILFWILRNLPVFPFTLLAP